MLWLWCRLEAVALIGLLPWEPPYAAGLAPPQKKRQKKKNLIKSVVTEGKLRPFIYIFFPRKFLEKKKLV